MRRPADPRRFNGTVVVEWLNVTGGVDADPEWTEAHNELIRDGFAWVGVSAQAVGVNALKTEDAVRYATLSHPGDSFSYDIFSQAGRAVRQDASLVLDRLRPRRVLAAGESQSAGRLVTYIDAVHPVAHVYDGYLVHSRFSTGTPLSQSPQPNVAVPNPASIRADLRVPVFVFETETDVALSNLADRQPDTRTFRLWEVAGTSHYDYYGLVIGPDDIGNGQGAVADLAAMEDPPTTIPPGFTCNVPINTGPAHWALDAAVFWLNVWVTFGTPPPTAPRLAVVSTSPVVYGRDANGNVIGRRAYTPWSMPRWRPSAGWATVGRDRSAPSAASSAPPSRSRRPSSPLAIPPMTSSCGSGTWPPCATCCTATSCWAMPSSWHAPRPAPTSGADAIDQFETRASDSSSSAPR